MPSPQLSPWQPLGELRIDDVPIAVHQHFVCGDHNLQYVSWFCDLGRRSSLYDDSYISRRIVASLLSGLPDVSNCMTGKTGPTIGLSDESLRTQHAFTL